MSGEREARKRVREDQTDEWRERRKEEGGKGVRQRSRGVKNKTEGKGKSEAGENREEKKEGGA